MLQQGANARSPPGKVLIGVVTHQHIGRTAPVGDDDRPLIRRAFGARNILVEFATGQGGHFGAPFLKILNDTTDTTTATVSQDQPTFPCEREGSCLVGVLGMLQAYITGMIVR